MRSPVARPDVADIDVLDATDGRVPPTAVIDSATEAGASTLHAVGCGDCPASLLAAGVVHAFSLFVGSRLVGGAATRPVEGGPVDSALRLDGVERLDEGVMLESTVE